MEFFCSSLNFWLWLKHSPFPFFSSYSYESIVKKSFISEFRIRFTEFRKVLKTPPYLDMSLSLDRNIYIKLSKFTGVILEGDDELWRLGPDETICQQDLHCLSVFRYFFELFLKSDLQNLHAFSHGFNFLNWTLFLP